MDGFIYGGGDAPPERPDRSSADRSVFELELRLNRALLTVEALWSLLAEKTDLTEKDLHARIAEIDAEDGRVNGRKKPVSIECEACGRVISPNRPTCMYCGGAVTMDPFS